MTTAECSRCKRWQVCPGDKVWFSYGDVRWCVYQVLWILRHEAFLHSGKWPPESQPESPKRKGKQAREAYFAKAVLVIAEVEARLKTCGHDGEALTKEAEAGRGIEALTDGAYNALLYVKGKPRKSLSYGEWDWQRTARLRKLSHQIGA
jgi:hypothetical protein